IEGNPMDDFMNLVLECKPTQVTLVPDAVDAITSNAGWDTVKHQAYLKEIITEFQRNNIRTSIIVDPVLEMVEEANAAGIERIELYTETSPHQKVLGHHKSLKPDTIAVRLANNMGLSINAAPVLSSDNTEFFKQHIPGFFEVSIGHAFTPE